MSSMTNVSTTLRESEHLSAEFEPDVSLDAQWEELKSWTAEDDIFMELAAKQEAIKRQAASEETYEEEYDLEAEDEFIYEQPKTRLGRLRAKLGQTATLAFWGAIGKMGDISERGVNRRNARQEKYAADENDGFAERMYKKLRRNQEKVIGGAAVAATLAAEFGFAYLRLKGIEAQTPPLRHYNVNTAAYATQYEFGGRGDPAAQGVMDGKAASGRMDPNINYIGVNYPATIAPVDNGPSLDQSTDMGADAAFQDYLQKKNSGQEFYAEGFSEGSIAALKLAQRVKEDNGGTLPSNFHLILEGSPVTSTGFFQSDIAQSPMIKPMLQGLGINPDTGEVPAGTVARYSQNDMWANGANQSVLGTGIMAMDLGYGHVVQDPNKPHIVWVDSAGVIHEEYDVGVHPFSQMIQANGGYINDGYNSFFQDIAPINDGINNNPNPPAPSAYNAQMDLARGIDEQTGNTGIPQQIAAAIPQPITQVMQDGLDLANTAPDKILQDPTKIGEVIGDVNDMLGHVQQVLPSDSNGNGTDLVKDFISGAVHNVAPEASGPVNSFLDSIQAPAPAAPAPAPVYEAPAPAPAPVYEAPAPAPAAPAPAIPNLPPAAPQVDQLINQGTQIANDLLGGLFRPAA